MRVNYLRGSLGCIATILLMLAGCRQETPKAPNDPAPPDVTPKDAPPVVGPTTPKEKPDAKPTAPASLEEATRLIDFRTFPMFGDGKDLYKSADVPKGDRGKDLRKSETSVFYYLRRKDGVKAAEFYRTKLTEAGWKIGDDSIRWGEVYDDAKYFLFNATKQGYQVEGGVIEYPATGLLSVSFTNHGNVDSRSLPRFAGTEFKQSTFWGTVYTTDAKPEAVLKFTQAELEKAGWREIKVPARFNRKNPLYTWFIQRGIHVALSIDVREGKTELRYQLRLLRVELPIMPNVRGDVEFLDGEKSLMHFFYGVPTEPEKVLEFYRKELPAYGWTMRAGTDKIENGEALVMLDAPAKESLRLELLATKDGETLLLIAEGPGKEKKVVQKKPAVKPPLVTEKELKFDGKLTKDSTKLNGELVQVHPMKMSPDKTYVIDMESKDFDAFLRIRDSAGKQLASDDDSGGNRNARIRFTPPKEAEYQILATRFGSGLGNYVLKIRVLGVGDGK